MTTKQKPTANANGNGAEVTPEQQALIDLGEAITSEQQILEDANTIWADAGDELTAKLYYGKLRALLRRPIPTGFIEHVGVVTGKPYESTGVKSVQVQLDRLDSVLRQHWGYEREFTNGGKLCVVHAWIGTRDAPLVLRDSYGGVKQGSTDGNIYKGSFTNAAKLAFARLGPGWEVYVGAADFDPDTDSDMADEQGKVPSAPVQDPARKLPAEKVEPLETAVIAAGLEEHLPMKLRGFGAEKIEDLSVEQALALYEWARAEALADVPADGAGEESSDG